MILIHSEGLYREGHSATDLVIEILSRMDLE